MRGSVKHKHVIHTVLDGLVHIQFQGVAVPQRVLCMALSLLHAVHIHIVVNHKPANQMARGLQILYRFPVLPLIPQEQDMVHLLQRVEHTVLQAKLKPVNQVGVLMDLSRLPLHPQPRHKRGMLQLLPHVVPMGVIVKLSIVNRVVPLMAPML